MKKAFKGYVLVWAVLFILFLVLSFALTVTLSKGDLPGAVYWVSYVFVVIAFIGNLLCAYKALEQSDLKKTFYNIPLISISRTGLILTLVFGAVFMVINKLPSWLGALICMLIFAFTAIAIAKSGTAASIVEEIDDKVAAKTVFVKQLTNDAESLISKATTDEAKAACKKVFEALRYSDPMSNAALSMEEKNIAELFDEFSFEARNDGANVIELSTKLISAINERNTKCRSLK